MFFFQFSHNSNNKILNAIYFLYYNLALVLNWPLPLLEQIFFLQLSPRIIINFTTNRPSNFYKHRRYNDLNNILFEWKQMTILPKFRFFLKTTKIRIIIIDKKWKDKCLVKFYEKTIKWNLITSRFIYAKIIILNKHYKRFTYISDIQSEQWIFNLFPKLCLFVTCLWI